VTMDNPSPTYYISQETADQFNTNNVPTADQLKEEFPGFYNDECYKVLAEFIEKQNNAVVESVQEEDNEEKNKIGNDSVENIVRLLTELVVALKK